MRVSVSSMKWGVASGALGCALFLGTSAMAQTAEETEEDTATQTVLPESEDNAETTSGETIVVTGSRIRRPAESSISPVTTVSIQEMGDRGQINALDLVSELPALTNSETVSSNIGSFGDQGVRRANLRGLGAFRSLTVVDNRRRGTTSDSFFARQSFDWNVIPSFAIEQVGVLTGGASSTYGSDAVTGVINIKLMEEFDGVRAGGTVGFHDDYDYSSAYVTAGTEVGNGNAYVHFEYGRTGELTYDQAGLQGYAGFYPNRVPGMRYNFIDRAPVPLDPNIPAGTTVPFFGVADAWNYWYPDALGSLWGIPDARGYAPVDSNGNVVRDANGNVDFPRLVVGTPTWGGPTGTYLAGTANPIIYDRQLGKFRAVDLGSPGLINFWGCSIAGGCELRQNVGQTLWSPSERYNAYARISQDLGSDIKGWLEVNYARTESSANLSANFIRRSDNIWNSNFLQIADLSRASATNPDLPVITGSGPNPVMTPQLRAQLNELGDSWIQVATRELTELGPRTSRREQDYFFASANLEGTLGNGWQWDVHYDFSTASYSLTSSGEASRQRFNNGLNLVIDQATGRAVCRSAAARAEGCVPIDLLNGISPEAVAYIRTTAMDKDSKNVAHYVSANLSGSSDPYFRLPAGPIRFAVGAEARYDKQSRDVSDTFVNGSGFFQSKMLPFTASNTVYEGYVEALVPLIHNTPLIEELTFEGAYRLTKYSKGAEDLQHTYKAGLRWVVTPGLDIRGVYARAIRAPSTSELSLPGSIGFIGYQDPCGPQGLSANPDRRQNCMAWLNFTSSELDAFDGLNSGNDLSAGNPNLKPEISNTYSAGVVFNPRFAPKLSITADYFDMQLDNLIAQLGESQILTRCADDYSPTSQFCQLIDRDPTTRRIQLVRDTFVNVNQQHLRGIDVNAMYNFPVNSITSLFGGGEKDHGRLFLSVQGQYLFQDTFIDIDGVETEYAGRYYNPDLRIRGSISYSWKDLRLFWSTNYTGRTDRDQEEERFRTDAVTYHDFSLTYYLNTAPNKYLKTSFGVTNVFDNGPRPHTWTYRGSGFDRIIGRGFWASVAVPF